MNDKRITTSTTQEIEATQSILTNDHENTGKTLYFTNHNEKGQTR